MLSDAEALLAAINEMANAEKVDIAEKAEQEVISINEKTEAQIRQLRPDAVVILEQSLCAESETIINNAKIDINNKLVHEKNKAIENIFVMAKQNIGNLDEDTRKDFLKKLIGDAIDRTKCDDVHLKISSEDINIWESIKNRFHISIAVETSDRPSGTVIVETADGSLSIDNSIDTRLDIAKKAMRTELCAILFANEKSGEMPK